MKPILVPIGDFEGCNMQVQTASGLAKALGTELYLLHVEAPDPEYVGYEVGPQPVRDNVAREIMEHHRKLHALRDDMAVQGQKVHALVVQGETADKIVSEAERLDAMMIIVGAQHRGLLARWFAGDTDSLVISSAACPVLVVPESSEN